MRHPARLDYDAMANNLNVCNANGFAFSYRLRG